MKAKTDIAAKSGSFICGQKINDSSVTLCNQIKGGCNKKWSAFQSDLVGICKDVDGVELGRIFSGTKTYKSEETKTVTTTKD